MDKSTHTGSKSRRVGRESRQANTGGEGVRRTRRPNSGGQGGHFLHEENERLYSLLELSTLLTSTRSVDKILHILAVQTSALLGAERTSIFIYDEVKDELWSKVAEGERRKVIRVPANTGIIGQALRKGSLLNIPDAYAHPEFNRDVDHRTGFHTRNILAAPMRSHMGTVIGVMEVLNKKSGAFTDHDEKMFVSISSLAGVALENSFLIEGQVDLFESFIESAIHALGQRDRITYGHTIRVAFYADRIARAVSASDEPPFQSIHFSEPVLRKLRFAALLHDIGKITVPEAILNKRDKLYDHEVEVIRQRFEHIKLAEKIRAFENGGLVEDGYRSFCAGLDADLALIRKTLIPGSVSKEEIDRLDRMRRTTYQICDKDAPQLTENEHRHLILARGNLTPDEFQVMQDHVKKTWDILCKIDWTKDLKEVPLWAATHHERPNGTGYPMGLKAGEIPLEGQILAVADIYDALTAADRPYKRRIEAAEAKGILSQMADAGHVNKDIVNLFLKLPVEEITPVAGAGH